MVPLDGKRTKRDRIIVVLVSLTILAVFGVLAVRQRVKRMETSAPRPLYVSTVSPERADIRRTMVFASALDAQSSITVIPRISGSIIELLKEEASEVAPGELLARIDPEPYRLKMQAAESAWLLAESSYNRIKNLGSGASRQQLDEAAAYRDSAKSTYELARMQFEYSEVRSPVGGVVMARFADEGDLAAPDQPLFLIGNDDSLRAEVRIPEKHWPVFNEAEDLRVSLNLPGAGPESGIPAEILRISPSISPADRTFSITCGMNREDVDWPLGSRIQATFVLSEKKDTWSLPAKAVGSDHTLWRVKEEDSTTLQLELPPGINDGRRIEIPESWSEFTFVLAGGHRLRNEMIVSTE